MSFSKELGVKTKRQERCAFSITEDHLSRRGLGFDHDGMRHDCLLLVSSRSSRQSRGWKKASNSMPSSFRTAGSDGGCVQRGYFCPAVHETPTVVAQDQGVFLEGKSTAQIKRSWRLVRTGNTAVVSYINHQGGLRSHSLYRLAHQILG